MMMRARYGIQRRPGVKRGVPFHLITRRILNSPSMSEVFEFLESIDRAGSANYLEKMFMPASTSTAVDGDVLLFWLFRRNLESVCYSRICTKVELVANRRITCSPLGDHQSYSVKLGSSGVAARS